MNYNFQKLVATNKDILGELRTSFDKPELMKELQKKLQSKCHSFVSLHTHVNCHLSNIIEKIYSKCHSRHLSIPDTFESPKLLAISLHCHEILTQPFIVTLPFADTSKYINNPVSQSS